MRVVSRALVCVLVLASSAQAQVVNQGTGRGPGGRWTVDFAGNAQPVSVSGTVTVTFTMPALVAGSALIGHVITDSGSTTTVTGTVTVAQPTGSNLHVAVDSAPSTPVTNAGLSNLDVALTALRDAIVGSGPKTLTDVVSALNALTVSISGTVTVTGAVNNNDGAGNALTSNSTTTAATRGLDLNVRSILNTAPTTAGKLDVKGADGDVFVRQATASNLNATVVGASTPADNVANPTTAIGNESFAMGWDNTNAFWRRLTVSFSLNSSEGTSAVPSALRVTSYLKGWDPGGSVYNPIYSRTTRPASTDAAIVVRSLMPTNGTQDLPTMDAPARAGFHEITDGTNTAAVKAASTAALATDPSLVVALSPNSPLPAGSNAIGSVTNANLDAPISSRLKPADTLAKVLTVDTITNPVAITAASLPLPANAAQETGGNLDAIASRTRVRGTSQAPTMILAANGDTTLLAANANRVGFTICNASASPLLLKFGIGATEFSFNVRVRSGACYDNASYTGVVDGFWYIGADNFAMVSESL
jgi:hypothetical protein